MNARTVTAAAALAAAVVLLAGCYYTGSSGGLSEVTVGVKQPAAPAVSVALVVTASDLYPITASYPGSTATVTVTVPAGSARQFNLLINTASVTFRGTQTVDLAPGEQKNLSLTMGLDTTQIIVPDTLNGRIVQVSDMSGSGWTEITGASLLTILGISTFTPSDVDVDRWGRIYVGNYVTFSPDSGVFRFNDINDAAPVRVATVSVGVGALAVDRAHDYLYYTDDTTVFGVNLYRNKLSAGSVGAQESLDTAVEPQIGSSYFSGLAVDENGVLYLARHSQPASVAAVFKYDPARPAGSRVLAKYSTDLGSPLASQLDVWYSRGYVYVLSATAPDGKKIQKLDPDLTFVKGYGRADDFVPPESPGDFYGPSRFLAIPGRKLYIVDDAATRVPSTRLVALDDTLTGGGWATYGSAGSGTDQFSVDFGFWSTC